MKRLHLRILNTIAKEQLEAAQAGNYAWHFGSTEREPTPTIRAMVTHGVLTQTTFPPRRHAAVMWDVRVTARGWTYLARSVRTFLVLAGAEPKAE